VTLIVRQKLKLLVSDRGVNHFVKLRQVLRNQHLVDEGPFPYFYRHFLEELLALSLNHFSQL
jgi:hypothetical protein